MKKYLNYIVILFVFASITACSVAKRIKEPNSTVDDWRDIKRYDIRNTILDVREKYDVSDKESYNNVDISKLLATPPPPPIGNGELISFSITEEVLLKDVFIELGRLADVDIQIDPRITSGIILKVTDKPLNVVIDKICDIANLKYEYEDGVLKIERDLPYTVNYELDALGEHELWTDIQTSLEYLLKVYPIKKQTNSTTTVDNMTLNIVDDTDESLEQQISINKAISVISVYANSKAQKAIESYINKAKGNYGSQVLIEAKVIEVSLNDSYKAGINWTLTEDTGETDEDGNIIKNTFLSILGTGGSTSGLESLTFNKKIKSKDLNIVIDAMQEFGDTKTLSSPRISTLNNQKAKLDFINTLVYFSVEKTEDGEDSDGNTEYTYTSTKQEEEVGVKLEITPTIDLRRNDVTLNVKPELSSLVGYVEDPVNDGNKVPQIQKRTLETSLKIKSGEVMVIGGLMSEIISNSDTGIPFLMNIPILGNLFKSKSNSKELVETVIFIKATIINKDSPLTNSKDRKMYNDFGSGNNYYKD